MLDMKLKEYADSDIYPFHMPGHKRRIVSSENPYRLDITEIDGFDNLHHAGGILKDSMERAAALYGAKRAFYLVNGSTCGILAAICAAAKKRSRILVARNSHKSVFHALFLQELSPVYLYPQVTEYGILGQITPETVENALKAHPDASAVVVTSPTYDGIVSDIRGIAEIAHAHGVPLIVDEAHGAHFGFSKLFPENAVRLGADAVIMSLHKTLGSFTQTALLLLCSDRIAPERVERYLGIFETSSPSYLLMAGMERCLRDMKENGEAALAELWERLGLFRAAAAELQVIQVLGREAFVPRAAYDFDASKLILHTGTREFSGKRLMQELRERFRLELEMASGNYALAMTSIYDTEEGFTRLAVALAEIDRRLFVEGKRREIRSGIEPWTALDAEGKQQEGLQPATLSTENEKVMELHEADGMPKEAVEWAAAAGRVSAEYLYLYPPGIPMLVPGERIEDRHLRQLAQYRNAGFSVEGLPAIDRINVVI